MSWSGGDRAGREGEAWTRRDFAAHTLRLFAERPEVKDRYWTAHRAVYCPRGNELHPEKKHIVLDGRLRADPSDGKLFSFLYLVKTVQPESESASTANLEVAEANMTFSVDIEFTKGKPKTLKAPGPALPGLCFLTNPKKVEANTMLVALKDTRLDKIIKETAEERKKDELSNDSFRVVCRLNRGRSAAR